MVTDTGEVLNTAAADQDDRVLLQVVTNTGDVGGNLVAVGETHTGDLTQSGVGLLGGGGSDSGANASLLGRRQIGSTVLQGVQTLLQSGRGGLVGNLLSTLSDQLVKSRHSLFSFLQNFAFQHILSQNNHCYSVGIKRNRTFTKVRRRRR